MCASPVKQGSHTHAAEKSASHVITGLGISQDREVVREQNVSETELWSQLFFEHRDKALTARIVYAHAPFNTLSRGCANTVGRTSSTLLENAEWKP